MFDLSKLEALEFKRWRTARGWSRDDVATRAQMTRDRIYKIEYRGITRAHAALWREIMSGREDFDVHHAGDLAWPLAAKVLLAYGDTVCEGACAIGLNGRSTIYHWRANGIVPSLSGMAQLVILAADRAGI